MDNDLINLNLKGVEIQFKTKPGVFSRHGLDEGSKLLIDNLEVRDETVVADLGTGSGVVGLWIAKLNSRGHVHLLDDSLRATKLAEENVELNGFKNVEVFLSDMFSAVGDRTYHLIVSNPPQDLGNEFLEELAKESFNHLKNNGETVWVVQKQIKPVIERLFQQYFGNCETLANGKIHTVIKGVKRG